MQSEERLIAFFSNFLRTDSRLGENILSRAIRAAPSAAGSDAPTARPSVLHPPRRFRPA